MEVFLGIETSCDDTSVALIRGKAILAHLTHSQNHREAGGVVPSHAAREHAAILPVLLDRLEQDSAMSLADITGIGVTMGPGLVGGLLVGASWAKGFLQGQRWAQTLKTVLESDVRMSPRVSTGQDPVALLAIHHLAAHGLVVRREHDVPFPFLLLLMSGGHCILTSVHGPLDYTLWGQSLDDAPGECLDKVARAFADVYPGGAYIETLAKEGDPHGVALPIPLEGRKTCDFSFSGLKTACIQWIRSHALTGPDGAPRGAIDAHKVSGENGGICDQARSGCEGAGARNQAGDRAGDYMRLGCEGAGARNQAGDQAGDRAGDYMRPQNRTSGSGVPKGFASWSLTKKDAQDLCASLQRVMGCSLARALTQALDLSGLKRVVVAGGVAANAYFRQVLQDVCQQHDATFYAPSAAYCGDNGVMIAWAAWELWQAGYRSKAEAMVRPQWSLESWGQEDFTKL